MVMRCVRVWCIDGRSTIESSSPMAKPPMCEKSEQSHVSQDRLSRDARGRARTVDARDEAQPEPQDQLGNERKEHPAWPGK